MQAQTQPQQVIVNYAGHSIVLTLPTEDEAWTAFDVIAQLQPKSQKQQKEEE